MSCCANKADCCLSILSCWGWDEGVSDDFSSSSGGGTSVNTDDASAMCAFTRFNFLAGGTAGRRASRKTNNTAKKRAAACHVPGRLQASGACGHGTGYPSSTPGTDGVDAWTQQARFFHRHGGSEME
jgi:hypothetical protein